MSFLEYAPAPESRAILNLRDEYGLFIDGEFVAGRGTPFQTISPATEERIATIATADAADVDTAVAAARRAHDRVWSRMSGSDRGKYLFRIARLIQERSRELAVADRLYVSVHTVNTHMKHIFTKLGINSRVELTRLAIERGIDRDG